MAEDDPLTFTTGPASPLEWGTTCALVATTAAIGLVLVSVPAWSPAHFNRIEFVCHVIGGLFFGSALPVFFYATRSPSRGTYRIDDRGVSFQPTRGRPVTLCWGEIERVRWPVWGGPVTLRGGSTRIRIPFPRVARPTRCVARARLASRLKHDFDLSNRPVPDLLNGVEPVWLNWLLRLARLLGLGLLWGVGVLGSVYATTLHYPQRGSWQALAVFGTWLGLGLAYAWHLAHQEEKVNPTWRARLAKSSKSAAWDDW